MNTKLAILITAYNRKNKTLECLNSIHDLEYSKNIIFDTYLLDDNSSDGTYESIINKYPNTRVYKSSGNLFWAGGMRKIWEEAIKNNYDGYLLLNDDTVLISSAIKELLDTHEYCLANYNGTGIYIGSTRDILTNQFSYGGRKLLNKFTGKSKIVIPNGRNPQECHIGNANIMLVMRVIVDTIGILSDKYTHSLADYDYCMRAMRKNIPILTTSNYIGYCTNDHGNNWLNTEFTLDERIIYLKSPKYLAYNEYLHYVKKYYPMYFPVIIFKLWMKTLFPNVWEVWKNRIKE